VLATLLALMVLELVPGSAASPRVQDSPGPVLVIAPHPDDETLGCGGMIATRAAEGRRVVVVVVTDGRALFRRFGVTEPSELDVSAMRKAETLRAVEMLGASPRDVRFLDFENERLAEQGAEAGRRLQAILSELSPSEVYVTSPFEGHREHVLTNELTRAACAATGKCPSVREYVVTLGRGQTLDTVPRRVVPMNVSAVRDRERRALAQFRSHLDVIYKGQPAPLTPNYDRYLTEEEPFLVDK
jgi:LmbE family N-acetylglucosaminyl deacetylase